MFLEILQNSQENTCVRVSFLIKTWDLQLYLKKRLWHMCFPVNFVKTKFWWPLVAACGRKKWEVFFTFKLQSYNSVGISKRRSNFKNLYLCCFCCVANIMRWLFVEFIFWNLFWCLSALQAILNLCKTSNWFYDLNAFTMEFVSGIMQSKFLSIHLSMHFCRNFIATELQKRLSTLVLKIIDY